MLRWTTLVVLALSLACGDDGRAPVDSGVDAGTLDGGSLDAGAMDAGEVDAGTDAGATADAGALDAGDSDAGVDAGPTESVGEWAPMASSPLSARSSSAFAWTGTELLVWGGVDGESVFANGARYDPDTDMWTEMASAAAPAARYSATGTWAANRFVVFGGFDSSNDALVDGGVYDPMSGAWSAMAPSPLGDTVGLVSAARVGSEVMVVGDGVAFYDPALDRWRTPSTEGQPAARQGAVVAWTGGREVVVWGGSRPGATDGGLAVDQGAVYDVIADTWTRINAGGAPATREAATFAWDGADLIIWGGYSYPDAASVATGARYVLAENRWRTLSTTGRPAPRVGAAFAWTGSHLIVWGGSNLASGTEDFDNGYLYDPEDNAWSAAPANAGTAPPARRNAAFAWTGSELIVWGGRQSVITRFDDGGRYTP